LAIHALTGPAGFIEKGGGMKLTKEWLAEKDACSEGVKWFLNQKENDSVKVIKKLVIDNHWDWANWLIVRVMTRPQYLAYAIFAAEQVIDIFDKKYPKDKRPRQAIDAAKEVLKNDTPAVWAAAVDAAGDARASAWAAWAAGDARASAWAAWAASVDASVDAAGASAWAAVDAAGASAWASAWAAGGAGDSARAAALNEMSQRIIDYGIDLLGRAA
jgi:hypothetical protein